jgi:hypothetical protein
MWIAARPRFDMPIIHKCLRHTRMHTSCFGCQSRHLFDARIRPFATWTTLHSLHCQRHSRLFECMWVFLPFLSAYYLAYLAYNAQYLIYLVDDLFQFCLSCHAWFHRWSTLSSAPLTRQTHHRHPALWPAVSPTESVWGVELEMLV